MATKKTAKKATAKQITTRSATKKTAARKAPATAQPKAITTKQTKLQIIAAIAEDTGLPRKDVAEVFKALGGVIGRHMRRRGSGEFTIPETGVKIRRLRKPATKARKGTNPFTGEPTVFAAKPARNIVKLSALKLLKDTLE